MHRFARFVYAKSQRIVQVRWGVLLAILRVSSVYLRKYYTLVIEWLCSERTPYQARAQELKTYQTELKTYQVIARRAEITITVSDRDAGWEVLDACK